MELLQVVREQCEARGENRVALIDGDVEVTYAELSRRIDSLSEKLAGIAPAPIAVECPRSVDCVVAWLASWNVNRPFVAVDPSLPDARRRVYRKGCSAVVRPGSVVLLDGPEPLEHAARYVFYSSGSTGQPKGIVMPGDGLWPVIDAQIETFQISTESRVSWGLSPGFDASLSDVFTALCAGATLVIGRAPFRSPTHFAEWVGRHRISHADVPPSFLNRVPSLPQSLETVVVGGDLCSKRTVERFAASVRLVNCYGPTETTVCSSMRVFEPEDDPRNIGAPIRGTRFDVVDGELIIDAPGVALRYLGGDDSRFVDGPDGRRFRTGDLVQPSDTGIIFRGRRDRQVKVRGMLVSPEEVEAVIRDVPGVSDVTVYHEQERLVADCEAEVEVKAIRTACQERLPDWMVPEVRLRHVARNRNQKVERDLLRQCFTDVIGFVPNEHDDFWECGGDSLMAIDLVARARERGLALSVEHVVSGRTVAGVRSLARRAGHVDRTDIVALASQVERSAPRSIPLEPGRVFLTGATGFLGSRVLEHLVARGIEVTCLVRRDANRIDAKLGADVVVGDLRSDRLGLTADELSRLVDRCDTVLHLASHVSATVPFVPDDVLAIVESLKPFAQKRFVHASTLSLFGNTDFRGTAYEHDVSVTDATKVFGGYAANKMLEEFALRRAFSHGCFVRLGLLTDPLRSHTSDTLNAVIKRLAQMRRRPETVVDVAFDFTPVGYAADHVRVLLEGSGTYHVSGMQVTFERLVQEIEDVAGRFESVSLGEFEEVLRDARDPLAFAGMSRLFGPTTRDAFRSIDLFLATDIRYDRTRTDAVYGPAFDFDAALRRHVRAVLEDR